MFSIPLSLHWLIPATDREDKIILILQNLKGMVIILKTFVIKISIEMFLGLVIESAQFINYH